ncbi:MAG: glycosyltransferase family 4 protein [Kiritimatiellae bacterium]|nr:glycosyltransferase family 4 protein [Kiritimatiellia bacterium]
MNVATIYTLYGRRAGAEMCFEKTLEAMARQVSDIHWTVLCNRESLPVVEAMGLPGVETVGVPELDNQFKKAFWLEFRSARFFGAHPQDAFWNPSGCNHFPGKWPFPTVTTFHDLGEYHVRGKYDFKRTVFRKRICIPRSVRRSAAFTAVSRFTAADMARILGIRDVHVVCNGPSPYRIAPVENAREKLAAFLGAAGVPERFWFVPGRTDYTGKGLDVVLDAIEAMRQRGGNPGTVFFAGPPGEGHGGLLARLAGLDPEQRRYRYLGRVDDEILMALYQECFAVVLASRFEGFGFPVLEAMDAGAPVVCSDAGSLPEVAGGAALLFSAGDAAALSACIERLLTDGGLPGRLREAGRAQSRNFSWERCGREMLEVLRAAGGRAGS